MASSSGRTIARRNNAGVGGTDPDSDGFHVKYELQEAVFVIHKGLWHTGKIIKQESGVHPETPSLVVPCYLIHYPGWGKRYDEWVMGDAMMKINAENTMKKDAENLEAGPIRQRTGVKSAGKSKSAKKVIKGKLSASAEPPSEPEDVPPPQKLKLEESPSTSKSKTITTKNRGGTAKRRGGTEETSTAELPSRETSVNESVKAEEEPIGSASTSTVRVSETPTVEMESLEIKEESPAPIVIHKRTPEEYWRMSDAYDSFDPAHPEVQTSEQQSLGLKMIAAMGIGPDTSVDKISLKSSDDRREIVMGGMRILNQISFARLRKKKDSTILSVELPPKIKNAMAHNYIQHVRCLRILKVPSPELSAFAILDRYQEYAEKQKPTEERSEFWNKARLGEIESFKENFDLLLPRCLFRHEYPLLDLNIKRGKKDRKDSKQEFGFVVVVRMIQMMVYFHNLEGNRYYGSVGTKLMAIYQDFLQFIEENIMPAQPENLDDLYADTDADYRKKIAAHLLCNWIEQDGNNTFSMFHYLPDQFFEDLLEMKMEKESEFGIKVVWKKTVKEDVLD